eukprot:PLAT5819.1.p1 GENE.PLAT5819.1~~PLAT5819.1.p1  ORF type:complete len:771 (-),score=376.28 PLAT5819.1:105-2393(-)
MASSGRRAPRIPKMALPRLLREEEEDERHGRRHRGGAGLSATERRPRTTGSRPGGPPVSTVRLRGRHGGRGLRKAALQLRAGMSTGVMSGVAVRHGDAAVDSGFVPQQAAGALSSALKDYDDHRLSELSAMVERFKVRYNELRGVSQRHERALESMENEERDLARVTRSSSKEATVLDGKKAKLEKRVQKLERGIARHAHKAAMYRHMAARLSKEVEAMRREEAGLMKQLERAHTARETEGERSKGILQAREQAEAEAELLWVSVEETRRVHSKCRRRLDAMESKINDKRRALEEREELRAEIEWKQKNGLSDEATTKVRKLLVSRVLFESMLDRRLSESSKAHDLLVEGFHRIREATGVDDPTEVVKRFLNRTATVESLKREVDEKRQYLQHLGEDRDVLTNRLRLIQSTGLTHLGPREIYVEIDLRNKRLREARAQLAHSRASFVRVKKADFALREGMTRFCTMLDGRSKPTPAAASRPLAETIALVEAQLSRLLTPDLVTSSEETLLMAHALSSPTGDGTAAAGGSGGADGSHDFRRAPLSSDGSRPSPRRLLHSSHGHRSSGAGGGGGGGGGSGSGSGSGPSPRASVRIGDERSAGSAALMAALRVPGDVLPSSLSDGMTVSDYDADSDDDGDDEPLMDRAALKRKAATDASRLKRSRARSGSSRVGMASISPLTGLPTTAGGAASGSSSVPVSPVGRVKTMPTSASMRMPRPPAASSVPSRRRSSMARRLSRARTPPSVSLTTAGAGSSRRRSSRLR